MEEKERYELNDNDCIIDNEKNMAICDVCDVSESPELIVDLLNQQYKENEQLKQQLHDLPKNIVGEIEKNFTEYLPLKHKTGAGFYLRLNAILKKYGGEDE